MHVGLVMECDYRDGRTQEEAFAEAFSIVDIAEEHGIDGVWLAERHFAGPRRPTDPMGGASRRSLPCPSFWLPPLRRAPSACGSAPVSASCHCAILCDWPRKRRRSIRSARAVSTLAWGAAASRAPMRDTACPMTRAVNVFSK